LKESLTNIRIFDYFADQNGIPGVTESEASASLGCRFVLE
jgi:hypothetical protein